MQIKSKIWIEKESNLVFGSGKAHILKAIAEQGSINKAAKQLNMSYRSAWSHIRTIEKRLNKPLLIKNKGGKNGGGAKLTEYAKDLINKFEKLEYDMKKFVNGKYREIFE